MTNYGAWDSKATTLVRDAEDDDKKAKEDNDKALGLEGGPKGPPTVKAEAEIEQLGEHAAKKKAFVDIKKSKEVTQTHKPQEEPIKLDYPEVIGKAIILLNSEGVTYVVTEDTKAVKLVLNKCKNVTVQVDANILCGTIEVIRCADLRFDLAVPVGTFQIDECDKPVLINYAEFDHVGTTFHHNSPGLKVGFGGELHAVGVAEARQYTTRKQVDAASGAIPLRTEPVRRGEGGFPVDTHEADEEGNNAEGLPVEGYAGKGPNIFGGSGGINGTEGYTPFQGSACVESQAPEAPESEEQAKERRFKANARREAGNDMFRAADYFQAAMEYTQALMLDPTVATIYANRAQCWMKVGDHEKGLADAEKCVELEPSNSKGWFRRGMCLHALKRYQEAIPHLLEAEKLEPNNKQIPEAIKFAQMMCRNRAAGA